MYRVEYEQGNGYHCNCCRKTWNDSEDFETEEEVIEFILNKEKIKQGITKKGWEDEDDWVLMEVREIKDDDLTSTYEEIVRELIKGNVSPKLRSIKINKIKENIGE
jgi:hypothetical protein